MQLLSHAAQGQGGVAAIPMTCGLSRDCEGALLLCVKWTLCSTGTTEHGDGGRLAAGDFKVAPGESKQIPLEVTSLGKQFAALDGGYESAVLLDMNEYGLVQVGAERSESSPSGATVRLSSSERPPSPIPGNPVKTCEATGSELLVGAGTSCGFAAAVYKAWLNAEGQPVKARSPVTGRDYLMRCTGQAPVICTGGNDAIVVFY